jgi:hypothetical protein
MAEVIIRLPSGATYGVEEADAKAHHKDAQIISYADGSPYEGATVAEDDPINTPVQVVATAPRPDETAAE